MNSFTISVKFCEMNERDMIEYNADKGEMFAHLKIKDIQAESWMYHVGIISIVYFF